MKIISLFTGAGGFDLGMINAGHEIVWANDFDLDCVLTYKSNIGSHIIHGDISEINAKDIPDAEAVIGGFPCQGFSQANMLRAPSDDRNKLYKEFLRIVMDKNPLYFLAENVRGILSLDSGKAIAKIINDFKKAGYRVQYKLFNAADYGVPQIRQRVIIAGTRNDLDEHFNFCFPQATHQKLNGHVNLFLKPWVSISDALNGIPEPGTASFQFPNHVCSMYKVTNRNFTGHRQTDPIKPSPTILARGNGKGGVCAIQHPKNHRRMSVRESAKIQSFPMDFEFSGKLNSCYRQVGNAVPVLLAEALGKNLKSLEKIKSKCA